MKWVVAAAIVALSLPASAAPIATRKPAAAGKRTDPKKLGAVARVNWGRELRPPAIAGARRQDPLTAEETTAAQLQKLLRGPFLRGGVTGIFVADAKTGEPLFAVNADDPLNVASNVKLISTATAMELLGSTYRYPTRVLGPAATNGVVKGTVYLLGSHDPTLTVADLDELARTIAARGITRIDGNLAMGSDPTRDGIYRAVVPITITAGEPDKPAIANLPAGFDLIEIRMFATTAHKAMRPRLTYKTEVTKTAAGDPHIVLTIGGVIGKDGKVDYPLWTKQRTATAAYALLAALRAHNVTLTGSLKTMELGDFVGDAVATGALPVELGRHESLQVGDIVARINKWSINWLADRLVMTAAGLAHRQAPSMELAVTSMYGWLDRHPHLARQNIVLDSGSGLSYRTQISVHEIVSVLRSAGGYTADTDSTTSRAWLHSLSVAGTDGTLRYRFRNTDIRGGKIIGKTGTLHNVIALSGILDLDPQRPLAFSIVTNTVSTLSKPVIRRAHEQLLGEICKYVARTTPPLTTIPAAPPPPPAPASVPDEPDVEDKPDKSSTHGRSEGEESIDKAVDKALDSETADHQ
ncbi:MAG: D-alanyl-D-alanine carboxypeptidase [Kofleriaceae bacterium]